jgi:hypothetical protein
MRFGKRGWLFGLAVAAVVTLSLYGDVGAQGVADEPGVPPAVDVTVDTQQSLSGAQMLSWVEEQIGVARGIYRRVQNMLDRARKDKDTLKITCLDDKLTQIHVNLQGIEERHAALEVAVKGGDTSSANQQFTILKIYVSRIQGLMAEAENCIGDSDVVIGETETIVTIDDDITLEDPTEVPDVDIGVDQPVHASGFY